MRINVYSQEMTAEVSLVDTVARDTGIRHYGVRLYLKSPDCLHHNHIDDDRSAITFWIPEGENFSPAWMAEVFVAMSLLCRKAAAKGAGQQTPKEKT